MRIHWIWLAHRPGLNDRMKWVLLQHFQDPEQIYYADYNAFDHIEELGKEALASLREKSLSQAEEILDECVRGRIQIITLQDAAYPARLKNISDPPVVLYCKGQLPDLDSYPAIGVVGTRSASVYGLQTAKRMGYQIARGGGIVVSGMAHGIDGMAMEGALLAGAVTVGVLGCGIDIVYPASNRELFRAVEQYGCILSEFAPGTAPAKWTFPRRNRIISGLSDGVLVVEAPQRSGSLITARLALDQGRDVFVVPGNIDQPGFVGSNQLLRDGAALASCGWDVLSEYQWRYPGKLRREMGDATAQPEKNLPQAAKKTEISQENANLKKTLEKKDIDNLPSTAYSDVNMILDKLSPEEKTIVSALGDGACLADDLVERTGLNTGKLLACLTMLELKGVIRRLPGKRVERK